MSQFEENRRKDFSRLLRQLMENWKSSNGKRLSQDALGEALYVSRTTVSHWLNGKQYPSKDTLVRLAEFFSVPVSFFSDNDDTQGMTLTDESIHEYLEKQCEESAAHVGLSPHLVSFLKENPGLSDLLVSACWINPSVQSIDPAVPEIPGNVFQIVASSGVKVYLPDDVISMLSVVQQDLIEAAEFSIRKRSKVIEDFYRSGSGDPPSSRFSMIRDGMSGLTRDESSIISIMRLMDEKGRTELARQAAHIVYKERKEQRIPDLDALLSEEGGEK